ncbi:hypothetical protein Leryth_025258 [Lithospermum erythrorhizon]|nr:hypothetical protein Leryth_025258 [Lithospermum erythrorhizon]
MARSSNHLLILTFGLLGNVVSFLVFLAPLPTFYTIFKKKSTKGFQSIPYVVALFSSMLWLYYSSLKANTTLLVTINAFGCFIETIYISFFLFYAHKSARIHTMKSVVLLIIAGFGLIVGLTHFLVKDIATRGQIVGWICLVTALSVFVAPSGHIENSHKDQKCRVYAILSFIFPYNKCRYMVSLWIISQRLQY